jgi:UDP-2,3-diacylglucosamine pyrophosphatase LpxH
VHLGTPDCRADYLLGFLRALRCETLYLVGDIVDLEALARRAYWPASHAAVIGQLLGMAASGTRVVYIPGNHDAPLRGLAGQTISGIEVKLHAEHVGADGRRYRVSHGDEFDPEHIGKSWLVWVGDHAHRLLCWLSRGVNRVRRGLALPYLPLSIAAKSRIGAALAYIRQYEQRVVSCAAELGYDGHVCGHIHYGTLHEREGVLYLNDGDWVEHCTAITEGEDGGMTLLHWSEQAQVLGHLPPREHLLALDRIRAMPLRQAA